ncbi:MAG: tetratricopeptide repeat protein [Smithellaceae bacterium]
MRKSFIIITILSVMVLVVSHVAFGQVSVSDEAKKYFDRGVAAIEMAKTPSDYAKAVREFEQAVRLAPQWPEAYYNLALVQEKAEKYGDAAASLRQYLRLAPDAADAAEIKALINKLEYRKEQIDGSRYIDSLGAKVTQIKFFEGGYNAPPKDQRNYQTSFARTGTRYVYSEINLEHPAPGKRRDFTVETIWFNPYGNEIFRGNLKSSIQADWTSSYHWYSYGWRDAASSHWIQGEYRVDFYANGIKIASEKFTIY